MVIFLINYPGYVPDTRFTAGFTCSEQYISFTNYAFPRLKLTQYRHIIYYKSCNSFFLLRKRLHNNALKQRVIVLNQSCHKPQKVKHETIQKHALYEYDTLTAI